jgi:hypothetical protein
MSSWRRVRLVLCDEIGFTIAAGFLDRRIDRISSRLSSTDQATLVCIEFVVAAVN